jgi:hypothetical protein
MVHARIAGRAVGQVKKEGGDVVGATSIYCTKAIEDVEDEEEVAALARVDTTSCDARPTSPMAPIRAQPGYPSRIEPGHSD